MLPVERFVADLRAFHVRLMEAMADRVWAARADWSRSDVAIDLDGLEQEHTWRVQWGDVMLDAAAEQATDWDAVLGAVAALKVRHPTPAR
jgi:hypothetical protein